MKEGTLDQEEAWWSLARFEANFAERLQAPALQLIVSVRQLQYKASSLENDTLFNKIGKERRRQAVCSAPLERHDVQWKKCGASSAR